MSRGTSASSAPRARPVILQAGFAEARFPCADYLRRHGYAVQSAPSVEMAGHGPAVLALYPQGGEDHGLAALEHGADDSFPCSGSPRELLARIRAVLRRRSRSGRRKSPAQTAWALCGYVLDEQAHLLWRPNARAIRLSPMQFALLRVLSQTPGGVLSRAELMDFAPQRGAEVYEGAIDCLVSRLRKKVLAATGCDPIVTHRTASYSFDPGALLSTRPAPSGTAGQRTEPGR